MRWSIYVIVGLLYTVQFIPAFFTLLTLPIVMRESGHSATTIGLVQLVGLPYIFKFLWAPLIDKYAIGRNRYKSWIVLLSALHVLMLLAVALLDPSGPIFPLFIMLFLAMAAVSTQDVAIDALVISILKPGERGMGASFQNFGIYAGAIIGGFGFLYLFEQIGWTYSLLLQAMIFALPLFSLFFVQEPQQGRNRPPVTIRNVLGFFTQPGMWRWIALLATIRLPLIMTSLPIRLMMVDQGMTTEEIALWFGLFAMSAAGGVSIILGPFLRNLPRLKAFYLVTTINVLSLLVVSYVGISLPQNVHMIIILVWAAIALTDIALFRSAMDKVRPEIPGFDFSIQVAVLTLLPMATNPVTGLLYDNFGHSPVFVISIALTLPPLVILYLWITPMEKTDLNQNGQTVVSTGTLRTDNPRQLLALCQKEFSGHGLNCTLPQPDHLMLEEMHCVVEMKAVGAAVDIRIETPSDNFMTFIRDEIVTHVGEIDPQSIEDLCWTGGINAGELPNNFRILRAVERQELFPGLIRVTLSGIDVKALTQDGIHLKLMMPAERARKPVWPKIAENGSIAWPQGDDELHARFVTIRHIRLEDNEIDVDIAHHDGGLISTWAAMEADGQEVGVMGPGGDPVLPQTDNIILASDLTGLPALARLIDNANGQVSGHLFAATPNIEALTNYLPASNLTITAIDPTDYSSQIATLLANCPQDAISYGWFAGEFEDAQAVRAIFKKQFKLTKHSQQSVAYWRRGVPGHSSRAV